MTEEMKAKLVGLSDDDLFSLLDAVSEEVKRRNNLAGPSIPDIRTQSVDQNVKMVLEALAGLGVQIKPKP